MKHYGAERTHFTDLKSSRGRQRAVTAREIEESLAGDVRPDDWAYAVEADTARCM